MNVAALLLAMLSTTHSASTEGLVRRSGKSAATVVKHLRALAERGFVFCEDDYDGRNRKGGKYAHALWVMNCETSGFSVEQAEQALSTEGNGSDILSELGLGC